MHAALASPAPSTAGTRAVITAAGSVVHEPTVRPQPGPGQALLRTRWSLVSPGTELAFFSGTHSALSDPEVPWAKYPMQPGYAAVGEVVEADSASGLRPGQRVFHHGRHATWALVTPKDEVVLPLPMGIDERLAPLARLAQIGATAHARVAGSPRRVLVLGAGMVGILAAQRFVIAGASVAVLDVAPARLALARSCGLAHTLAGDADAAAVAAALGGEPDCVIEATGVPALVTAALTRVAVGGEVVLLGSPRGRVDLDAYKLVHLRATRLTGAHECSLPTMVGAGGPSRRDLNAEALAAIADGRLRVAPLVTHTIAPAELADAYHHLVNDRERWLGVLVDWRAP